MLYLERCPGDVIAPEGVVMLLISKLYSISFEKRFQTKKREVRWTLCQLGWGNAQNERDQLPGNLLTSISG